MNCHAQCGACCIAPQITSALPNMPMGKPAGVRCVNLGDDLLCQVYLDRPDVCKGFTPEEITCGTSHEAAILLISDLETKTAH